MKKHLYIIGARGFGREIYNLFLECRDQLSDVDCIGFLDDNHDALNGFENYPPIISSVEEFMPKENDRFICALGDPKWVEYYSNIIEQKGGEFLSIISPMAHISSGTTFGAGCSIFRWSYISCDVKIGNHVSIGNFSVIGHDVAIDDYCHLGAYSFLGGGVQIGKGVTLHPRVNIVPHKKIRDNAILGAGSVVIKSVAPNSTVFGIPAKKI